MNEFDEICKLWIDKFTANGFYDVFKMQPFRAASGNNYKYFLESFGGNKDDIHCHHTVQIRLEKKRLNKSLECSKFFVQNLTWLFRTENTEEFKYLIVS